MEWQKVINRIDQEMQELQREIVKVERERKEAEAYKRFLNEQLKIAENNPLAAANPMLAVILLIDVLKEANIIAEYFNLKNIEKDMKNLYNTINERLRYIAEAKQYNIAIDEEKEKRLIDVLLDLKINNKDKNIREILNNIVNKIKENQNNKYIDNEVQYA